MNNKKTLLEEALLDIEHIKNALNANTKEILRSVSKEEIDAVVKESLAQEAYTEETIPMDEPEMEPEMGGDSLEMTDVESPEGLGGEEAPEMDMAPVAGTDELGMDGLPSDEMDLTDASDDDVIAVYKKLSGEDEIEIVGDEIHLNVSQPGEYVIKTSDVDTMPTGDMAPEMGGEMEPEMGGEDDVDYEIEMDDDAEGSEEAPEGGEEEEAGEESAETETPEGGEEESGEEEEEETIDEKIAVGTGMSVGNHRNPTTAGSIGAAENPKSIMNESVAAKKLVSETTKKYNALLTEAKKLKTENEEFRKVLKQFRTQLVETVVFNSNLSYVTRLFTDYSTTKAEKQSIIKRFDEGVSTLAESKKLYKTIINELESRKSIAESVESKIVKESTSSSSKQLNETTAYVDPSTKRILELMKIK
jgi:hypothetical protein